MCISIEGNAQCTLRLHCWFNNTAMRVVCVCMCICVARICAYAWIEWLKTSFACTGGFVVASVAAAAAAFHYNFEGKTALYVHGYIILVKQNTYIGCEMPKKTADCFRSGDLHNTLRLSYTSIWWCRRVSIRISIKRVQHKFCFCFTLFLHFL